MINWRNLCYFLFMCVLSVGLALGVMPGDALAAAGDQDQNVALEYDLIVVGSDPEGVAAAISGARNTLKTLLVDTRPAVGGLMTQGWLNSIDMNVGPGNKILNGGIFLELYQRLGGDSFDVPHAQRVFDDLVSKESSLDLLLSVAQVQPMVEKNKDRGKSMDQNVDGDEYGLVIRGVRVTLENGTCWRSVPGP